jgi:hypothetical protein
MKSALEKYIAAGTLKVTHQTSGQCDRSVTISYLSGLQMTVPEGQVVLIWYAYTVPGDAFVKVKAKELTIWLIYILPEMKDTLQLLDGRIFGNLKTKMKAGPICHYGGNLDNDDERRNNR